MERKEISAEFSVSGQLSLQDIPVLAAQGVRSIICNRPDGEAADQSNVAEIDSAAREAGLTVTFQPVRTSELSEQDVTTFQAALEKIEAPTHAFCRTGTRSLTLWALAQRRLGVNSVRLIETAREHGYDLSSALQSGDEALNQARPAGTSHYDILIVGGGAAGIAAASSLLARVKDLSIAIIDPAEVHYYQPGWTLVGAGVFRQRDTVKTMASLVPEGVNWKQVST